MIHRGNDDLKKKKENRNHSKQILTNLLEFN